MESPMRLTVLTVLTLLASGCQSTQAARADSVVGTPVRLAAATRAEDTLTLELEGVTVAANRAVLSAQQGGRMVARPVRIGDTVQRGSLLVQLDTRPWRNQLNAREAQLRAAQESLAQLDRDLVRLSALNDRGSLAGADLETLQSRHRAVSQEVEALRMQRQEAARQLEEAVVVAPFSGTVTAVHGQPGETVAPGQPLVELAGAGLEVAVQVPESAWVRMSSSTPVSVHLPALGSRTEAAIVDLATAGARDGLFPVVVGFDPPARAVAGLTTSVELALPQPEGVVVPLRAIVDPTGDRPSVFVVREGVAKRVPVGLNGLTGRSVRVTGLASGEDIVVAGQAQLIDGSAVAVQP
jgi:RND family efflux transporter MFP subunit